MKKFLGVLLMIQVLFASACSDEKPKIGAYKNNFVKYCTSSARGNEVNISTITDVCNCAFDKIVKKYGINKFIQLDKQLKDKGYTPPEVEQNMVSIVESCLAELKENSH
ncbi:hypothetical protein QE177_08165 [Arsenophonus sp. aPb]|uniref:hypothetical protein n=1 Tax=Arsenophonus sp. aPb TaxID=3041619 RepID=UPI0024683E6C|nr:hypothetical protein [Arsenophonus sp. aPb]WGL97207.1 hypothetical protein QE177_08165 [Arsenophonus sp. aPb]